MESLLLKPEETAKLLGLGRTKVYEMLAAGQLPVIRIGRNVRVPREQLQEWIKTRTLAGPEPFTGSLDIPGPARRVGGQRD